MWKTFLAIQRWNWLIVLLMIGNVLITPWTTSADSKLLPTETADFQEEIEEVESDDPLDPCLISLLDPLTFSFGQARCAIDSIAETRATFAASHLLRGPPRG